MQTPASRARERCDLIGAFPYSDRPDVLFRPYLGAAHRLTLECLTAWMREAGMSVSVDAAGNIVGRYGGLSREAPALLLGSHVDSVENGGRYDGMLGVVLGIEVVDHFHRLGKRFPFALEVIGFGDEEGSRFPLYMLGSRAVAGSLVEVDGQVHDRDGVTLAEALSEWDLTVERLALARRDNVIAYVEAHIEQAPHLERAERSLGVVRGIASQLRYNVTFNGMAAHAGTVLRDRFDALAAAAEAIGCVEAIGRVGPDDLVTTVGVIQVPGGAPNIVPGRVEMSVDIRALDVAVRDEAARTLAEALERIAAARGVSVTFDCTQDLLGAPCDERLNVMMERAVRNVTGSEAPLLVSQAGHDAMIMANAAPMTMLFIRCEGGISHNPAEAVRDVDVEAARCALIAFVGNFGEAA